MKKILAHTAIVAIRTTMFFCAVNIYTIWATQTAVKLPVDFPMLSSFF